MQKPLWVKINKNDFDSLMQSVYNNLTKDEFKTTVNKKVYGLKSVKKFLVKITTQNISEMEAFELYSNLITPEITELENTKERGKNKRHNILAVLKILESVFTGVCLHYKNEPSESEQSIVERTKLRRQRSAEQSNEQPYTENMPDLESEESAAEQRKRNQQGKGLKILTPNQILSRLPIVLAQLKAGDNSEKLKNEIRQLLYSLYRSKKTYKTNL